MSHLEHSTESPCVPNEFYREAVVGRQDTGPLPGLPLLASNRGGMAKSSEGYRWEREAPLRGK